MIKTPELVARGREPDPTRIAEGVARAVGVALIPHLAGLKENKVISLTRQFVTITP